MGELPGYDHWKTTDPNDDGSTEAIERLEAAIAADKDQVRDLCTNLLDKAGNEEFSVKLFIALGDSRADVEELISLAERCYSLREEAIATEALRQFNEPPEH